jgi:hypothetical protein
MEPPKVIAIDEESLNVDSCKVKSGHNPLFDLGSFAIEDINLAQIP